jgi:hypothetical protein
MGAIKRYTNALEYVILLTVLIGDHSDPKMGSPTMDRDLMNFFPN